MSTNVSRQRDPEKVIIDEINALKTRQQQSRSLQPQGAKAIQVKLSPVWQGQILGMTAGSGGNFVASLAWTDLPPSGNVLLATFEFALFVGSIDTIGIVSSQFASESVLTWKHWQDWWLPELYAADPNANGSYPVTDIVRVTNVSGATKDVYIRARWRYLVVEGDVSGVTGLPAPPDGPQ